MHNILVLDYTRERFKDISSLNLWKEREDFFLKYIVEDEVKAMEILKVSIIDVVIIILNNDEKYNKIFNSEQVGIYTDCVILVSPINNSSSIRVYSPQEVFEYIIEPISEEIVNNLLDRAKEFIINKIMNLEFNKERQILKINITNDIEILEKICKDIYMSIYYRVKGEKDSIIIALNKIVEDIYMEIYKDFPWIDKLTKKNIFNFYSNGESTSLSNIEAEFTDILLLVNRIISKYKPPNNKLISTTYYHVLNNIDKKISLDLISKLVYVNKSYLSYVFKRETSHPFIDFLTEVKMDRAKILLMNKKNKIYEVSKQLGYSDSEYFSKVFKSKVGLTPSEYRKQYNI